MQTPGDAPPSVQDTVHLCTPHVRERVYTAATNDNSKPQLPSKPTAYNTDMVNKHGEKLAPWPCSLCLLVGHVESANSHPMQRCHANPQNPNWKPPIARMRAKDIVQRGHPLPKCLECIDLPPDVKAKAQANAAPTPTTKTVTHAQMNKGAEVFESYMQTGEMGFEEAFTAAVESTLGVEVT